MQKIECDVAVIGGGCAGLSLGYEYAQIQGKKLSVCILEKREDYHNDRTWSFWLPRQHDFSHQDLILHSWKAWRFSSRNRNYIHRSKELIYSHISALSFYQKTTQAIEQDSWQTLVMHQDVTTLEKHKGAFKIEGPNLSLTAKHVIDTRPYEAAELIDRTRIFQIFAGVEIEVEVDIFDPEIVGLMDDLKSDHDSCHFRYFLPFTKRRALIEMTSFSTAYFSPTDLDQALFRYIDGLGVPYQILREERGVLPMGIDHSADLGNGIILGGMKNNNLKPSSGYGFLRTQIWAKQMAQKIFDDTLDIPLNKQSHRVGDFFDDTFLRVLQRDMRLAENIFLSIGENMRPDSFAKFMRDDAGFFDFIGLIAAVPKKPFIKAVF